MPQRAGAHTPHWPGIAATALYAGALLTLFAALVAHVDAAGWRALLARGDLLPALRTTLATTTIATLVAGGLALPIAHRLARRKSLDRPLVEALIDLPMSLSPLVMGMALVLAFATPAGHAVDRALRGLGLDLRGGVGGVVLAQVVVATAFAVRGMRAAFAAVDPRCEAVALTLGCTPAGAFWRVTVPSCGRALAAAVALTWARAVGEFGPVLLLVGITPGRTEVLSTGLYLAWTSGDITAAAALAVVMLALSLAVLLTVRWLR